MTKMYFKLARNIVSSCISVAVFYMHTMSYNSQITNVYAAKVMLVIKPIELQHKCNFYSLCFVRDYCRKQPIRKEKVHFSCQSRRR